MLHLVAVLVSALLSGPPWISVEYPANPFDAGSRNAYLLVHAFHHGTPTAFPVSGTAEGLVDGKRRTITLEFRNTSRPGVYAVHKQWPDQGVWTLILGVTQGSGDMNTARAIVEIGSNGRIANVHVPTKRQGQWLVPDQISMSEIERGLRARAN